jgi:hypothetical protein
VRDCYVRGPMQLQEQRRTQRAQRKGNGSRNSKSERKGRRKARDKSTRLSSAEVDVTDSGYGLAEEGRAEALEFFDGVGGVEGTQR